MSQKIGIAEKKKFYLDGEELQGLTAVGDISLEKNTVGIPEFYVTRQISNGTITLPTIDATFRIDKESLTLVTLRDWYGNNESHDVTIVRTDAQGAEFARTVLTGVTLQRYFEPAYDATAPDYARVEITMLPFDLQMLEGEG